MPSPRGIGKSQNIANQLIKGGKDKDPDFVRINIRLKTSLYRKIMIATQQEGLHSEQDTIRAGLHRQFGGIALPDRIK